MAGPDLSGLPPELARKFELLRQQFRQGLAQRLALIEGESALPELEMALHQLAGVAAGYGYEALGQLARQAEHACRQGEPQELALRKQELVTMLRQISAAQV